jgi:hypothetical protein
MCSTCMIESSQQGRGKKRANPLDRQREGERQERGRTFVSPPKLTHMSHHVATVPVKILCFMSLPISASSKAYVGRLGLACVS